MHTELGELEELVLEEHEENQRTDGECLDAVKEEHEQYKGGELGEGVG